jgi:hypothetical protein
VQVPQTAPTDTRSQRRTIVRLRQTRSMHSVYVWSTEHLWLETPKSYFLQLEQLCTPLFSRYDYLSCAMYPAMFSLGLRPIHTVRKDTDRERTISGPTVCSSIHIDLHTTDLHRTITVSSTLWHLQIGRRWHVTTLQPVSLSGGPYRWRKMWIYPSIYTWEYFVDPLIVRSLSMSMQYGVNGPL